MNSMKRFLQRVVKQDVLEKPVGRWFRDSCEKTIARKVDLSNEDHCGPCGEYAIQKSNIQQNQIKLPLVPPKHKELQ